MLNIQSVPQSIPIERQIRSRALERMCDSPGLITERIEVNRAQRAFRVETLVSTLGLIVMGAIVFGIWPIVAMGMIAWQNGVESALVFQSAGSIYAILGLAILWSSLLRQSKSITVFSHLPLSESQLVRNLWKKTVVVSLGVLDWNLLAYSAIAYTNSFPPWQWGLALLVGIGQWLVVLTVVPIVVCFVKRQTMIVILCCLCLSTIMYIRNGLILSPSWNATILVISPTGWLNGLLSRGILQGQLIAFWSLVPTTLLLAAGAWAFRQIHQTFKILEFAIRPGQETEAITSTMTDSSLSMRLKSRIESYLARWTAGFQRESVVLSRAAARQTVLGRDFMQKQNWRRLGWVERWADRCLTPRERILIEFLSGQQIQWTVTCLSSIWQLPIFFGIPLLVAKLPVNWTVLFVVWLCISSACQLISSWPAFRSHNAGGTYATQISHYPAGFVEVSFAIWKVQLVRSIANLPLVVLVSAVVMFGEPSWPFSVVWISLAYLGLMNLAVCWYVVALYSEGCAFPNQRWRNQLWKLLQVCFVVCLWLSWKWLPTDLTVPLQPVQWWVWLEISGLLIVGSLGTWIRFHWLYSRGIVDLVRQEPSWVAAIRDQS